MKKRTETPKKGIEFKSKKKGSVQRSLEDLIFEEKCENLQN